MLLSFFPKEFNFFTLLDEQAEYAVAAAKHFKELVAKGSVTEADLEKMQNIEHQGDEAAHTILDQLNKIFITPFDREDIHALAKELDDVTDMINTIASRMMVYDLRGVNKNLVAFASVIEESVLTLACVVKGLQHLKNSKFVMESCVEINRLENVGDSMRDKVLAELFETEKNPIAVIKWKEIYEDAETVLDICEDVAHVVQSILMKQA